MSKELDMAVARALGFRVVKDAVNVRGCQIGTAGRNGFDLPYYSEDARLVALLLAEIERRLLKWEYLDVLADSVAAKERTSISNAVVTWAILTATPEQHCRAFIAVCTPKP